MDTIIIDGKTYKLIPIEDSNISKDSESLAKAKSLKEKYDEYKNIPNNELSTRIKMIDELSDEEYIIDRLISWFDWDRVWACYETFSYNPFKSLAELREYVVKAVRKAYIEKIGTNSACILVEVFKPEDTADNLETIRVSFIPESLDLCPKEERDYLLPTD